MARSESEIRSSALEKLRDLLGFTPPIGDVIRDLVVPVNSAILSETEQRIDAVERFQSLDDPESLPEEILDIRASNVGLFRIGATRSTGFVAFRRRIFSPSDSDVIIPTGTLISTEPTGGATTITYRTTARVVMFASLATTYFNPDSGFFEVLVPVESVGEGTGTHVGPNALVRMVSPVIGIDSVTNPEPITNGVDSESNTSLTLRIQALRGSAVGTVNGIITIVASDTRVRDLLVVVPGDPELTRNQFGSSVDVYILGEELRQETDIFTITVGSGPDFVLFNRPVRDINSIVATFPGQEPQVLVRDVDYTFLPDIGRNFKGSVQANDRLHLLKPLPENTTIEVSYSSNALISDLQKELNKEENRNIGSDILVKEAEIITQPVELTVVVLPRFDLDFVERSVTSAIRDFSNSLRLFQALHLSDLIGLVEGVDGVNFIKLPLVNPANDIIIKRFQALRLDPITVNAVIL